MTKFIKLTKEQMQAAGKRIMADVRCDADVKASVRRGLTGKDDSYTYTTNKNKTWFDLIFVESGIEA